MGWNCAWRKGLYLWRIILYRVGETDVLESADAVERDGTLVFARHLHIGPRTLRLVAAVSDTARTHVELVGNGARLARDGNHVRLSVPEGGEAVDVTVMIASGGPEVAADLR